MSLKLKIPPPIIGLICALLMWLISRVFTSLEFKFPLAIFTSMGLLAIALCIDILALLRFKASKTTINPMKPSSTSVMVEDGIYRFSRNPMYLGLAIILCAWGVYLGNFISLLLLPVFILYITAFQIIPEEQIMTNLFKEKYIQYKQKVRRWI